MADRVREQTTYLWVAETILRKHRRPLRARQIVNFGLDDGLFADIDLSKTPQKSMQSRLSMDIIKKRSTSLFMRTGRGKFVLRELHKKSQGQTKSSFIPAEYTAIRRAPTMPSENVLSIPRSEYASILDFQGINLSYNIILEKLLASPGITYIPRTEAETNSEYKQFVTYTIIQQREKVLSFRRG
ncbi:winged helix-turn-helix domain-containing protein [Methylobacterium sp. J-090]|uniref:winged helix-turn-helix domain-containing protein n=1 Tax=Methylobacterium sp. J-090 TaxID=2836666 RepID=UPI00391CA5FD